MTRMVPGRSHPKNGVQQGKAVLLHGDHRHPQALGQFLHGHIIQEDRLPVAEGVVGAEGPASPKRFPLSWASKSCPVSRPATVMVSPKKWFTTG